MATSRPGENEVQLIDIGPLIILPIVAGIVFDVWQLAVNVGDGYDFAQPIWEVGGAELSAAFLVGIAAIVAIVATNELDGSEYEDWEYGAIVVGLAILPAYEFIPAISEIVDGSDVLALGLWLLVTAVATYLAYTE